jgi:hypothetical protein
MTLCESNPDASRTGADVAERPISSYLRIYLNDHRAGAAGGIQLARRCARNNRGTSLGEELQRLVDDLRVDASSLDRISDHHEVTQNRAKQVAAVIAERLARFKPNGNFRRYSPLSRLLELEMLLAGIDAKASLWRTLLAVEVAMPPGIDLRDLEQRARDQRSRLEPHHHEAAQVLIRRGPTT